MKQYYTDWSDHALRYWYKHETTGVFASRAEEMDHLSVNRAMNRLSDGEKTAVDLVYRNKTLKLNDAIQRVCDDNGYAANDLWKIIRRIHRLTAEERGLL